MEASGQLHAPASNIINNEFGQDILYSDWVLTVLRHASDRN